MVPEPPDARPRRRRVTTPASPPSGAGGPGPDDDDPPDSTTLRVRWTRLWARTSTAVLAGVLLGLVGAWVGTTLAGPAVSTVGPLTVQTQIVPSWSGGTVVHLPPLGSVELPTHAGPAGVDATVQDVDLTVAQQWLTVSSDVQLAARAEREAESAVRAAALRAATASLVGALVLTVVVTRRRSSVVAAIASVAVLVVAGTVVTLVTFDGRASSQPTFTGALVNAPRVVGDVSLVPQNLTRYGTELAGLVENLTRVVKAVDDAPGSPATSGTTVIVHISDVHLAVQAWPLVRQVAATYHADAVVDTGDVADHGTSLENVALRPIATLGVPYVYVKGNHDSSTTVAALRDMPNVTVLDDSTVTIDGITIAGAGDPRFTPDKTTRSEGAPGVDELRGAAARLRTYVSGWNTGHPDRQVDVVAFHDPTVADVLDGVAPTLLFGHLHTRYTWQGVKGSRIMVQGSTGGAGLRALEGETPTPVSLSVLYFSQDTGRLTAFDDITLGGLGATTAEVKRYVVAPDGSTPADVIPDGLANALSSLTPDPLVR
jgi:predicted phosphodiesterase